MRPKDVLEVAGILLQLALLPVVMPLFWLGCWVIAGNKHWAGKPATPDCMCRQCRRQRSRPSYPHEDAL